MVATLTRALGARHLALAEEAVQDALRHRAAAVAVSRACPTTRRRGCYPRRAQPRARSAAPRADGRRQRPRCRAPPTGARRRRRADARARRRSAAARRRPARDDVPDLPSRRCRTRSRVALTLKIVGGFSVGEIARAFLAAGTRRSRSGSCARSGCCASATCPFGPPRRRRPRRAARFGARSDLPDVQRRLRRHRRRRADARGHLRRGDPAGVARHAASGRRRTPRAWALAGAAAAARRAVSRHASAPTASCFCCAIRTERSGIAALIAEGLRALDRAAAGGEVLASITSKPKSPPATPSPPSWDDTDWPRILDCYDELAGADRLAGRGAQSRHCAGARVDGAARPPSPRSSDRGASGAGGLSPAAGRPGRALARGRRSAASGRATTASALSAGRARPRAPVPRRRLASSLRPAL